MLDRRMQVVVTDFCLSSCANYLFVAGETKIVLGHMMVAWHGGPPGYVPTATGQQRPPWLGALLARQAAFFARIDVDEQLLYRPNPSSGVTAKNRDVRFWFWSAEELARIYRVRGIVWMPTWWEDRQTMIRGYD